MRYDETGLMTLPWKADIGGTKHACTQQAQQSDKPRAMINEPLAVRSAMFRFENRGDRYYDSQQNDQGHCDFDRGECVNYRIRKYFRSA